MEVVDDIVLFISFWDAKVAERKVRSVLVWQVTCSLDIWLELFAKSVTPTSHDTAHIGLINSAMVPDETFRKREHTEHILSTIGWIG